ncbi:TPA_exp: Uncharacterized protein A8136_2187 [Trichophyton benhamiae CBS 112371]|uniref:Uncharacterized protein n=1 Tax=Arthroderma benhamiae (strain ATCC MYA-4681 / CBS 112371) TaxID=663331 RepID=D4AYG4_ARTBC|nr:uncharacterized protein ARB_01233 [Trichophyton benhamiae CBS 112371]EFE31980.1 conserved hypothetical protein [Trichophyton benhamiae CBS 112371]DAA75089.1 TPA_exp: Uncharacterized protein A8136_2187 [Trichophyton benhamiae CBS 112371]
MFNLRFILGIISLALSSQVTSSPIHRPRRAELFNRGLYSTHTQNTAVMTLTVTPTVAGSTVPVTMCVDLQKAGSTGTPSIVPCPMITHSNKAADTTTSAPATSSTSTLKNGEVPAIEVGTGSPPISYLYSSSWYYFPTMAPATSSYSPSSSGTSSTISPSTTQPTMSTASPSSTRTSPISTAVPSDTTTTSLPIKVTSLPVSSSTSVRGTTSLLSQSTSDSQQSRPTTVFNTTTKTVYLPPSSTGFTSSYTAVPTTTSAAYPGWNSTLPSFSTITQSITTSVTVTSGFYSSSFTPPATTSSPSSTSTVQLTTSSTTTSLSTSSPSTTEPATESPTMIYTSFSNTLPSFTTTSSELSTSQTVTSVYAPAPPPTETPTTSSNPLVVIPVTDEAPAPTGIELIPIEP